MRRSSIWIICLLLACGIVPAEETTGRCAGEKSHQFDFWIGEWEVHAGGKLAGTNSIRPILDGCVLQESWSGAQGSAGSSFNFYNKQDDRWHQFWVWRNGTTLELSGGFADGKMILEGEENDPDGKPRKNRITWHDKGDGTIRQHWEQSADGGQSWQTVFDGLYKPKSP
jgi:hypothetical protein